MCNYTFFKEKYLYSLNKRFIFALIMLPEKGINLYSDINNDTRKCLTQVKATKCIHFVIKCDRIHATLLNLITAGRSVHDIKVHRVLQTYAITY